LADRGEVDRGPEAAEEGLRDAEPDAGAMLLRGARGIAAVLRHADFDTRAGGQLLTNARGELRVIPNDAELLAGGAGCFDAFLAAVEALRKEFRVVHAAFDQFEGAGNDGGELG